MDIQIHRVPPAQVEQYDYCLVFPLITNTELPPTPMKPPPPPSADIGMISDPYKDNQNEYTREEKSQIGIGVDGTTDDFPGIPLSRIHRQRSRVNSDIVLENFDGKDDSYVYESFNVSDEAKDFIARIISVFGRYYVYQYENVDELLRYVLIRGSVSRFKLKAEESKYKMLLDEQLLKDYMVEGHKVYDLEPIYLPDNPLSTKIGPYQYIYCRYRSIPDLQDLYWRPANLKHPFRNSIRIYFIISALQESVRNGGVGMNLRKMLNEKSLVSHYPLHSLASLTNLENTWTGPLSHNSNQPLFLIKEYFGVRIGLYFALIEHFTESFSLAAILGIIFQALILYYQDYNLVVTVAYGIFSCVWYTSTISFWKRKEKLSSLMWGTYDDNLEQKRSSSLTFNPYRPEFRGILKKSPIDDSASLEYDKINRFMRRSVAWFIWLTLFFFTLSVVLGIYILRDELIGKGFDGQIQWVVSGINGAWIAITNPIFFSICRVLVDFENHRTDNEYNFALQVKVLFLQFANSYASMYFLAFFGRYPHLIRSASSNTIENTLALAQVPIRLDLLAINLVTIFSSRCVYSAFNLIYLLLFVKRRCFLADTKYDLIDPSPPENPPSPHSDVNIDYEETYATGNEDTLANQLSINPASKIEKKKKVERKKLSALYSRVQGSYDYDANDPEVNKADEGDINDLAESGAFGSFRASFIGTPKKDRPGNSPINQLTTNDNEGSDADLNKEPLQSHDLEDRSVSKPQLSQGVYHATRTNYDVSYREMNRVERDYELKEFHLDSELVRLYSYVFISFGYVVIFGCLLPGISVIAVLDLYLFYRKEAFNFINVYKRVISEQLNQPTDIGNFYHAFQLLIAVAIVTNGLLMVFTMIPFRFLSIGIRLWVLIAIVSALFIYRYLASVGIASEPKVVMIQRLRAAYLGKRLIEQISDADPTFDL